MEVELINFRCFKNNTFKFVKEFSNGIMGLSGSGKSTIFKSIEWCLYGKLRKIYPNEIPKAKTKVTITFNDRNLKIERSNSPKRLIVTIDDDIYESVVAQDVICQSYGTREQFLSCSYIEQKKRNYLLYCTQNEKLEVLTKLIFSKEDPKLYLEKVKTEKKIIKDEFKRLEIKYEALTSIIEQTYEKLDDKNRISTNLYNKMSKWIDRIKPNLENIKTMEDEIKNVKTRLEEIQNFKLEKPVEPNSDKFEDLNLLLKISDDIDKKNDLIKRIEQLENSLKKVSTDIKTNEEYNRRVESNKSYEYFKQLAKSIRVNFNEEDILKRKSLLENDKIQLKKNNEIEKIISLYEERNSLLFQLSKIDNIKKNKKFLKIPTKPDIVDVEEISNNIITLKNEISNFVTNSLTCPNCNENLILDNKCLIKLNAKQKLVNNEILLEKKKQLTNLEANKKQIINSNKNLISKYEAEIKRVNNVNQKISNELSVLDSNIETYNEKLLNYKNLVDYDKIKNINLRDSKQVANLIKEDSTLEENFKILLEYKKVSISESDIKSCLNIINKLLQNNNYNYYENLSEFIKYKTLFKELKSLKSTLDKIQIPDEYLNKSSEILRKTHYEWKNWYKQNKIYESELEKKENRIKSYKKELENLNDKYNKILTSFKIKSYDDSIKKIKNCNKKIKHYKLVKEKKSSLIKQLELFKNLEVLNEKINTLETIEKDIVETECWMLENAITSINENLNIICNKIFNNSINVYVTMSKFVKSTKLIKPSVSLSIEYKGIVYENIDDLSGGEGDRISLALTIALNCTLTSSLPKLIIFDETLSSIDRRLQSKIVKLLSNYQFISLISIHEGVKGEFNNIIHLNS